jgi:hypothetical protein
MYVTDGKKKLKDSLLKRRKRLNISTTLTEVKL